MNKLEIITITKDDLQGVISTIKSTKKLRKILSVGQIVIDSSNESISHEIKKYLSNEENVQYYWQSPCGIAKAFNLGINKSDSEWIWFLNGRDEIHPDLNHIFLLQILDTSKAEIVIFELELMQSGLRYMHPPIWALWPPIYKNWVPHPATLIRKKLFDQYGGFNSEYKIAMDGELWFRLFSKNVVVDLISIPITLYDQAGISNTNIIETGKEAKKLILTNIGMLTKIWLLRGFHIIKALKHYILLTRSVF